MLLNLLAEMLWPVPTTKSQPLDLSELNCRMIRKRSSLISQRLLQLVSYIIWYLRFLFILVTWSDTLCFLGYMKKKKVQSLSSNAVSLYCRGSCTMTLSHSEYRAELFCIQNVAGNYFFARISWTQHPFDLTFAVVIRNIWAFIWSDILKDLVTMRFTIWDQSLFNLI